MITYGKKKREDGRLLLVRKKKKKYRKFLLNFSIPLFLGLLAWVVFIYLVWIYIYLVWTNIYLVWISPGTLAQLLSFFNLFLILFVGFWGVIFMLEQCAQNFTLIGILIGVVSIDLSNHSTASSMEPNSEKEAILQTGISNIKNLHCRNNLSFK